MSSKSVTVEQPLPVDAVDVASSVDVVVPGLESSESPTDVSPSSSLDVIVDTGSNNNDTTTSPAAIKALNRRFDMWLLAPLMLLYIFSAVDKANLAFSRPDIAKSFPLSLEQYSLVASFYQLGYLPFVIPLSLVFKLSRPSLYFGTICICIGFVSAFTAVSKSFADLSVVRVFLGIVEAGVTSEATAYFAMWYPKFELGNRNSIFFLGNPISNAISGLISYGLLQFVARGMRGWQWLFIITALPAFPVGLAFMRWLPDHPTTCRWLTPSERVTWARSNPL